MKDFLKSRGGHLLRKKYDKKEDNDKARIKAYRLEGELF